MSAAAGARASRRSPGLAGSVISVASVTALGGKPRLRQARGAGDVKPPSLRRNIAGCPRNRLRPYPGAERERAETFRKDSTAIDIYTYRLLSCGGAWR